MHTEAINHDPAITFIQTGSQQPGRPSIGAWLSYGLGSENQNLPAFVVLISQGSGDKTDQPLFSRLWGSGFLPSQHQGVQFRSQRRPGAVPRRTRRASTRETRRGDARRRREAQPACADERSATRRSTRASRSTRWRSACRRRVPELTDLSQRAASTSSTCTARTSRKPGTFAHNCLLARRLVERGVRFVQLYPPRLGPARQPAEQISRCQCKDIDQPSAALIKDLKQRGLLDDTLVIWGGEFGRTVYSQGDADERRTTAATTTAAASPCGWPAAASSAASMLRRDRRLQLQRRQGPRPRPRPATPRSCTCLGIDHERLTYRFQGRDFRLTDVHGEVVKKILA